MTEDMDLKHAVIEGLNAENKKLEIENKRLSDCFDASYKDATYFSKLVEELEAENKELREKVSLIEKTMVNGAKDFNKAETRWKSGNNQKYKQIHSLEAKLKEAEGASK